jgi:ABC-type cobalamin/Fe3+-siderophores transport system ATPase subunit
MISNKDILTTSNLALTLQSDTIAENLSLNLQAGKLIALVEPMELGNQLLEQL